MSSQYIVKIKTQMLQFRNCFIGLLMAMTVIAQAIAQSGAERESQERWAKAVDAYKKGDRDNSVPYFLIAAAAGLPDGAHAMGVVYEEGTVVPQNSKLAMKFFTCNAETGYLRSQLKLMRLYEDGVLVPKNLGEAYFWALIASSNAPGSSSSDIEYRNAIVMLRNGLAKKVGVATAEKIQKKAQAWKPVTKECYFKS
jgi:TPR repeat protein